MESFCDDGNESVGSITENLNAWITVEERSCIVELETIISQICFKTFKIHNNMKWDKNIFELPKTLAVLRQEC